MYSKISEVIPEAMEEMEANEEDIIKDNFEENEPNFQSKRQRIEDKANK